jgi:hypothetical protein
MASTLLGTPSIGIGVALWNCWSLPRMRSPPADAIATGMTAARATSAAHRPARLTQISHARFDALARM